MYLYYFSSLECLYDDLTSDGVKKGSSQLLQIVYLIVLLKFPQFAYLEADGHRHQDGCRHSHHQERVQEVGKENDVLKSQVKFFFRKMWK